MTTAPRLNERQLKVARFFWQAHKMDTFEIAEKLGVDEASVANSMEQIRKGTNHAKIR